jgi:hypothetical protein
MGRQMRQKRRFFWLYPPPTSLEAYSLLYLFYIALWDGAGIRLGENGARFDDSHESSFVEVKQHYVPASRY